MNEKKSLKNFNKSTFYDRKTDFFMDLSHIEIPSSWFSENNALFGKALHEMSELESGSIANADEERMVGHYWLRDSQRAPTSELTDQIDTLQKDLTSFCADILEGKGVAQDRSFEDLLLIGIGGSALGPQFLYDSLRRSGTGLRVWSIDNTDPDGVHRILSDIPDLSKTLFLVVSKSGGTKETRNGMLLTQSYCREQGVDFAKQAVAVTGVDSQLDQVAVQEGWLARFPMWDWVGGRTSVCSAVGLLPLGLQGSNVSSFLEGARYMDELTRTQDVYQNPALLLAAAWYVVGNGAGERDMVVLPYKDRLLLFSRYLQQLVMESLGKELDRSGEVVHQGIAVYGNKGSTDQHAYVQQLRDGINNFFVTFLEVLEDVREEAPSLTGEVESDITAADYLFGFLYGTRRALSENGRESLTITVSKVDEFNVGMLIALYERAVGFYASFVNINAYHQPGVEAGKKAASEILVLQKKAISFLREQGQLLSLDEIGEAIDEQDRPLLFKLLRRLAFNGAIVVEPSENVFQDKYRIAS